VSAIRPKRLALRLRFGKKTKMSRADTSFPALLFGPYASVQAAVKREAKRLAKGYSGRSFPEMSLIPVERGSLIFCNGFSDLPRTSAEWRPYLLSVLRGEIYEKLAWEEQAVLDFDDQISQFSWGALFGITGHIAPSSLARMQVRICSVLRSWPVLQELKFVDRELTPILLPELLGNHLEGTLDMWSPEWTGVTESLLAQTAQAMKVAGVAEIRARLAKRLGELAAQEPKVRNARLFQDPSWLASQLDSLDEATFDRLTGGDTPHLRRQMFIFDENA
jgi:hypothetical protein